MFNSSLSIMPTQEDSLRSIYARTHRYTHDSHKLFHVLASKKLPPTFIAILYEETCVCAETSLRKKKKKKQRNLRTFHVASTLSCKKMPRGGAESPC